MTTKAELQHENEMLRERLATLARRARDCIADRKRAMDAGESTNGAYPYLCGALQQLIREAVHEPIE